MSIGTIVIQFLLMLSLDEIINLRLLISKWHISKLWYRYPFLKTHILELGWYVRKSLYQINIGTYPLI